MQDQTVRVYTQAGSIYIDEQTNDLDQIAAVIDASDQRTLLDQMRDCIGPDSSGTLLPAELATERWNEYMRKMLQILQDAGFETVWLTDET